MSWNTPDDWNAHWRKCPDCGQRYHLADGGHDCPEDEPEPDDAPDSFDGDGSDEVAP